MNPIPDVVHQDDADVEEGEDVRRCYDIPERSDEYKEGNRNILCGFSYLQSGGGTLSNRILKIIQYRDTLENT